VSPPPQCNPNAVVWSTPEPPANPQAGDMWLNPKDGMEMAFVPAGDFLWGEEKDRKALPGFYISRYEITNAQYKKFVDATGQKAPAHWERGVIPSGKERFPIFGVTYDEAAAYCAWSGTRLPSEEEWEKAARGIDGREYPWGNKWDSRKLNWDAGGRTTVIAAEWENRLEPVGSHPEGASPYGVMDMAGSAAEWAQRGEARDPDWLGQPIRGMNTDRLNPKPFVCYTRAFGHPTRQQEVVVGFRCARLAANQQSAVAPATEHVAAQPASPLPPFGQTLEGPNEVRVRNPNDFSVKVGLRSGDKGKDWDVSANGVASAFVPDGRYDIYFVYSSKPDALFQGDSFTLSGNGAEIQIVEVVGGNYNIRQVK